MPLEIGKSDKPDRFVAPSRGDSGSAKVELVDTGDERAQRLKQIQTLAKLLDNQFKIPGTNWSVGLDGLIGLIPGIGDLATAALAAYIVHSARELGVPKRVLARMTWNVALDLAGGAVPIIGDLWDMSWKANAKNVRLLERYLHAQNSQGTSGQPPFSSRE